MTIQDLIDALSTLHPTSPALMARDIVKRWLAKAWTKASTSNSPALVRFQPRARFVGVVTWNCPTCGEINKHRLTRMAFKAQCGQCSTTFALVPSLAYILHSPAKATKAPPDLFLRRHTITERTPDYPMPLLPESLPLAQLGVWRPGESIHVLRRVDGGEVEQVWLAEPLDTSLMLQGKAKKRGKASKYKTKGKTKQGKT